ncbi:unnamed protein product [Ixodes pacificus]
MNPAKHLRHLETKHPAYKDRTRDLFSKKKNTNWKKATYLLSYRIAKQLKPHTICEDLIMSCIQYVVKTVIGEKHLPKVLQIPCSNDTVGRRIREMASNVESQVIEHTRNSPKFAIAVDQSCDISGSPQLVAFVSLLLS